MKEKKKDISKTQAIEMIDGLIEALKDEKKYIEKAPHDYLHFITWHLLVFVRAMDRAHCIAEDKAEPSREDAMDELLDTTCALMESSVMVIRVKKGKLISLLLTAVSTALHIVDAALNEAMDDPKKKS